MTRDEFIASNPIGVILEGRGVRLIGSGAEKKCRCPFHDDRNPSMSVNTDQGVWKCHAGCGGGSVIDLIAAFERIEPAEVLRRSRDASKKEPFVPAPQGKPEISVVYSYHDPLGNEVYQVVRMIPKTFRQRHRVGGEWVWSMDGVERVLYRLPEVLKSEVVWVVEGEKDADTLVSLGFVATCNAGGAGKWLDGYSESLRGKSVVLCGDNDEPGRKHVELVFDSLAGKAKEVRLVAVPSGKDVSDYVLSVGPEMAKNGLSALVADAVPFLNGIRLPIYHVSELEARYSEHVARLKEDGVDLGRWLPTLGRNVRDLVPGDLCMVLGGTGVGKTAILSNIAVSALPLPTLLFELELPPEVLFERLVALKMAVDCCDVERSYATGQRAGEEVLHRKFPNLFVCTEAKLTVDKIREYCERAELKIGRRPGLVLIDYVGLIDGAGTSRYDKFSTIAEGLKVLAKQIRAVVVCAVQISRKARDESDEVGLTDGKDSGSIENSAGLVLGCWRPEPHTMMLKVLKNTKGTSGVVVVCNYVGSQLRISERSPIDPEDVPK